VGSKNDGNVPDTPRGKHQQPFVMVILYIFIDLPTPLQIGRMAAPQEPTIMFRMRVSAAALDKRSVECQVFCRGFFMCELPWICCYIEQKIKSHIAG
jgi:hypothetical protein